MASLTLEQAQAQLSGILGDGALSVEAKTAAIRELVGNISTAQLDGSVPENLLLYGSKYSNTGGVDLSTHSLAVDLATSNPGKFGLIDNTHVGTFLADLRVNEQFTNVIGKPGDLSPSAHPFGSRIRSTFEPSSGCWATGWGAEPSTSAGVPARCFSGALMAA